jgi:hypothetical protein
MKTALRLVGPARGEQSKLFLKAFDLAWFLHQDPKIARRIAVLSLVGLPETYAAQARRGEYTPQDFHERACMELEHLLERRVFAESDEYEIARMNAGAVTKEDLSVFYLKEGIRLPMKYSSFQMMVSNGRVLHTYETKGVMSMYETIAPNRAINKADVQYREWKKIIMDYLEERFGAYLRTVSGKRGEKRFAAARNSAEITGLARECFSRFVLGETPHVLSNLCGRETPEDLNYSGFPDGEHPTELLRFHSIVCPSCFVSLAKAWGLPSPDRSLAIPDFLSGPPVLPSNRFRPPALSGDDLEGALDEVEREEESRRRISPATLAVVVDGQERCRLVPGSSGPVCLSLRPTDEVVRIVDGASRAVLVTHLPKFGDEEDSGTRSEYSIGSFVFSFEDIPCARLSMTRLEVRQRLEAVMSPQIVPLSNGLPLVELRAIPSLTETVSRTYRVFVSGSYAVGSWRGKFNPWIEVLREKIKEIDDLTREQSALYQKLPHAAHLPETRLDQVLDVVGTSEFRSRGSLWIGAGLTVGFGTACWLHQSLAALALMPFVTLSLLAWHYFRRSAGDAMKYFSAEQHFKLLRCSLESTDLLYRLSRLRGMFDMADKFALLIDGSRSPEGWQLVGGLQKAGYRIKSTHSTLLESDLKEGMESVICRGGTILLYFVGEWDQFEDLNEKWDSLSFSKSPSKDRDGMREFCVSRGSVIIFRAYQNLEENDFAGGNWSFAASCRPRPSHQTGESSIAPRIIIPRMLVEAFGGAACGPEGFVMASDVADYMRGPKEYPSVDSLHEKVEIFHSIEKKRDVLLMTKPPHQPEET